MEQGCSGRLRLLATCSPVVLCGHESTKAEGEVGVSQIWLPRAPGMGSPLALGVLRLFLPEIKGNGDETLSGQVFPFTSVMVSAWGQHRRETEATSSRDA